MIFNWQGSGKKVRLRPPDTGPIFENHGLPDHETRFYQKGIAETNGNLAWDTTPIHDKQKADQDYQPDRLNFFTTYLTFAIIVIIIMANSYMRKGAAGSRASDPKFREVELPAPLRIKLL